MSFKRNKAKSFLRTERQCLSCALVAEKSITHFCLQLNHQKIYKEIDILRIMEILVRYEEGVFKPVQKVSGFEEGEEFEIHLEREDWQKLSSSNPSFFFLKEEPELYNKKDVLKEK